MGNSSVVERLILSQDVAGSNPASSSICRNSEVVERTALVRRDNTPGVRIPLPAPSNPKQWIISKSNDEIGQELCRLFG